MCRIWTVQNSFKIYDPPSDPVCVFPKVYIRFVSVWFNVSFLSVFLRKNSITIEVSAIAKNCFAVDGTAYVFVYVYSV